MGHAGLSHDLNGHDGRDGCGGLPDGRGGARRRVAIGRIAVGLPVRGGGGLDDAGKGRAGAASYKPKEGQFNSLFHSGLPKRSSIQFDYPGNMAQVNNSSFLLDIGTVATALGWDSTVM